MNFFLFLLALICFAGPASADPITAAIATALGGGAVASAVASFVTKWLIGTALTLLGGAFNKQGDQQARGIRTSVTLSGGTNPQSFGVGRYATGGALVCPPIAHQVGDTPNDHLTYVIDLGDLPGCTLEKLFVNGEHGSFGGQGDGPEHADYGFPVTGFEGHLWVKYYDGTQTEADPMLLAKYAGHPDYPWSANMIGRNKPYAILTAKHNPDFWTGGLPAFRFEMLGIPLYDIRKDSTAGGSGSHRWNDPSTWEQTENLAVQSYNMMRGITLPSGEVWGGEENTDLTLSVWVAAMNECDVAIALDGGGTEPQYRGGIEVMVEDEPREVVDKLLLGCAGQLADVGGTWHIRVGPVGLPVYFLTDDDIVVSKPQELDPFPGLENTFNAVSIKHPSPDAAWEYTDAPARYRSDLEQLDRGRRLVADLSIDVVPYPTQIQRLGAAFVEDNRRFGSHNVPLPPDAIGLNVLDCVQWDSERNQYAGKLFEVTGSEKHFRSLQSVVALRERDPSDWNWDPSDYIPVQNAPISRTPPPAIVLPGFSVSPVTVAGDAGSGSRPAIKINYTDVGVASIAWRVRVKATEEIVAEGIVPNREEGVAILPYDALPATEYQVQALIQLRGEADWTSWLDVTTHNVRPDLADLDPSVSVAIDAAAASAAADKVDAAASAASAGADKLAAEAAALLADAAEKRVKLLTLDSTFALGLEGVTEAETAAPDAAADYSDPDLTVIASDDPEVGGKTLVATGEAKIVTKHVVPIDVDRKYRLRARVKRVLAASGDPILYLGFRNLKSDYSFSTEPGNSNTWCAASALNLAAFPVGSDYVEFVSPVVTGTTLQGRAHNEAFRDDTVYVRPKALLNYASGSNPDHVMHLSGIWFEDVTESEAAKDHANQAEVHKDAAATSEANAAGSASLAATSETLAAKSSNRVQLQSAGNMLGREFFSDGEKDPWESGSVIPISGHPNGATHALHQTSRDVYGDTWHQGDLRGRKFRIRGVVDATLGDHDARAGFHLRTAGAAQNYWSVATAANAGVGPVAFDFVLEIPLYSSETVEWRFFLQSNGYDTHDIKWSQIHYEDVTESDAAETASAQALVSETNAASAESNAAGDAAAAALSASSAQASLDSVKALKGNFQFADDLANWEGYASGTVILSGDSLSGGKKARCTGSQFLYYSEKIPVAIDRVYRVRARLKAFGSGGTSKVYVGVRTFDASGNLETTSPGTHRYCTLAGDFIPNDNTWREYEGIITGGGNSTNNQFRPTTSFASPLLLANLSQDATRELDVDYVIFEDITEAKAEAEIVQAALAETDGKLAASIGMRTIAGTSGAELELVALSDPENGDVSAARIRADNIIFDGSVFADHMGIENLAAITANLGNATINEKLTLGQDAGFLSGRPDRVSYEDDGFFVGATKKSDGSRGFEISHTHKDIYDRLAGIVHSEETGFQVFNPRFLVGAKDGAAVNNSLKYTTNGTFNIGSGRKELTLFVVGGGGAGGYGLSGGSGSGSAASGGVTSVEVYAGVPGSGGVKIGSTIQAAGGAGGLNAPSSGSGYTGTPGGNSSFGQGGDGGAPNTIGGDAASTAYGAGGGGAGGDAPSTFDSSGRCGFGGSAGVDKTVTIDLSAHEGSNIHLVVTIGGKGSGSGGTYRGGHGQKGVVAVADALSGYKEIDGNALYDNLITSLAKAGEQTLVIGDGADELGPFTDNRLYIIGNVVSSSSNNDYRVRQIDATQRRWIINMPGQFSRDELRTNTSNNNLDSSFDSPVGLCWVFLPAGGIQSWDGSSRTMTWENYSEIKDISEDMAREIIAKLQ